MMKHWAEALPKDACSDAVEWCRTQKIPSAAWKNCTNPSWMFWLLGRKDADRKKLVLTACDCARLALKHTKDPRVLACIKTTEAWANGNATIEQVRKARADAAYAASAYAASAAAASAAAAAYAASAYAAAASAADAADAADAAEKTQARCADIIRKYFPKPPKLTKDL